MDFWYTCVRIHLSLVQHLFPRTPGFVLGLRERVGTGGMICVGVVGVALGHSGMEGVRETLFDHS